MKKLSNIFTGLFFIDYWKMEDEELKECAREHNIEARIYRDRDKERKEMIKQLCIRDNHKIANTSRIYMIISIFCVIVTLLLTLFNVSKLILK